MGCETVRGTNVDCRDFLRNGEAFLAMNPTACSECQNYSGAGAAGFPAYTACRLSDSLLVHFISNEKAPGNPGGKL
jgi:hypothetical protein